MVSQRWVRLLAAVIAFAVVAYVGIVFFGNFSAEDSANSWALISAIALIIAFIAYAAVEYAQTRAFTSISHQFDTRTIVLMPIAIALNIILGQAVAAALKIPIYLDSIGTILVGALAGPIPGALTGFLANILWTYIVPPPFQSAVPAPFAIVAAVIGLLAGLFGRVGWLRPRPNRSYTELALGAIVALVIVIGLAIYAYTRFYTSGFAFFGDQGDVPFYFVILGWLIALLFIGFGVGFVALLFVRRDLTVAFVVVAGVVTGMTAALISAPISANLFSGVTGSGTDFLVAAFRSGGSSIGDAVLQQGLLSDPVDKLVTFFTVYLILNAMARRTKARFPQGERLVERGGEDDPFEATMKEATA
jgi:energy-coupling factor transport system substrate-specific component